MALVTNPEGNRVGQAKLRKENIRLASVDGGGLPGRPLVEPWPGPERLALSAFHPRLGEQVDPGPAAGRAHAQRETGQLVVVEIMLRLARWHCRVADHRVRQRQIVGRLSHGPCPFRLCPRGNDQTRKEPGLRPSLDLVPQGKIRGGHNRGTQNVVWPAMVYNAAHDKNPCTTVASATLLWLD